MALRLAVPLVPLVLRHRAALGSTTCLDDAIPPSERQNLTNAEGALLMSTSQSHGTIRYHSVPGHGCPGMSRDTP